MKMFPALTPLGGIVVVILLTGGCNTGPTSGRGFRLPDGNAEKGKAAFLALDCHTCHPVVGVELPKPESPGHLQIPLGGDVAKVKNYGELVTAIINPSHGMSVKLTEEQKGGGQLSPMPNFNEIMTVAQMIDLVAFLQPRYKLMDMSYPMP